MRVVITGGTGILGRAITATLRSEAIPLSRKDCDVTDSRSVGAAFEETRPDVVVHCAAMTDVDACEHEESKAKLVNMDGTAHVAQAAKRRSARLIVISTDYVFSGELRRPLTEEDSPSPNSVYGRTKLAGEGAAILNFNGAVILRTCGLYGPGGTHFPLAIARRIASGEPLRVVDDQVVTPTYARDLAGAIARIVHIPESHGLYHVANSGPVTWYEFAKLIAANMKKKDYPIEPISSALLDRAAPRPAYSALDSGKLTDDIGIVMRSTEDALRGYFRDSGGSIL